MDPFVAEIAFSTFNFVPRGWATCDGQLMPISENTALFALLGTMYGGDGKSTFALAELAGAAPMGSGTGADGRDYYHGEMAGRLAAAHNMMPSLTFTMCIALQGVFPARP